MNNNQVVAHDVRLSTRRPDDTTRLTLKLVGAAVASCFGASCFATSALAAGIAGNSGSFTSGSGSISTAGSVQTIINSPNAIIQWSGFNSNAGETIKFIQQSAASNVLNRVVGQDPSLLLGNLSSNGRVFIINPNGILFGASSVVDVNSLVASTLNITDADFLNGNLNFVDGGNAKSVVNQGLIRTATGGSVYLIAPDISNSGIIKSPGGEVLLAAGHSVQLIDAATPELQVQIDAGGTAVNVGSIIAHSGDIGIYGALITQGGKLDADSATVGQGGSIILHASQDIDMVAGGVTTASGGAGKNNAGSISIIADGSLNVSQGAEIHVDGGKQGGNGGELEVSGKHNINLQGTMTGIALAGYKGGSLLIDPSNISITTAGAPPSFSNPGPFITDGTGAGTLKINPTAFKTWADGAGWSTVTLTADKNLTVASAIGTALNRFNHNLNLNAGSIANINADIFLGAGKTLDVDAGYQVNIAPTGSTAITVDVGGDLNLHADGGFFGGVFIGNSGMTAGINLKAGGSIHATTDPGLNGVIIHAGNIPLASNGKNINTTVNITAGKDIVLTGAVATFISAGNVLASASGLGAHTATATADVNIKAGGDFTATATSGGSFGLVIKTGNATANAFASNVNGVATNTAKADSSVSITAGKAINISNTGNNAPILIGVQTAVANAYTKGNGGDTPSGSQVASANANVTLSAGTGITISEFDVNATSTGLITLNGGFAQARAHHLGSGSSNVLGGNNTATASASLNLKTTAGNITVTDGGANGASLHVYHGKNQASASQYATGKKNTITGNNTATATNGVSFTAGGDISLTGLNVDVAGTSATVYAYAQQVASGGTALKINTLSGVQKANATTLVNFTAGADINITARTGSLSVDAEDNANAYAIQQGRNGIGAKISTIGNTATATDTITFKAGSDINLLAKGSVLVSGGSAFAFAYQFASFEGKGTYSGTQAAAATDTVTFIAGTGNISLTATSGNATIQNRLASASAYQSVNNSNDSNTMIGNHAAKATGGITFTATKDITVSALKGSLFVNNAYASASAYQIVKDFSNKNTLSGNMSASATNGITLSAGGNLGLLAWNQGSVSIYASNSDAAYAEAFDRIRMGDNNKLSGDNAATAANGITLKAGALGNVQISGGNVYISAGSVYASGGNYAQGNASSNAPPTALSVNNNTANAKNTVSITAGKDISIKATNTTTSAQGDLTITLGSNADALAENWTAGLKNTLRGNNAATATNTIALQAGRNIVLQANDLLRIEGSSATASANNYISANHNSNNIVGTNTAKTTAGISFTATTGGITMQATGNGGTVSISANNSASASAYNYVNGSKNKVSGNNSATAGLSITLTAATDINLAAKQAVHIYANDASASAYNSVNAGASNTVTGNHTATASNKISLSAIGNINIFASNNSISASMDGGASASAYNFINNAGDKNVVTGNNTANAAVGISFSAANITLDGSGAYLFNSNGGSASAYNQINGSSSNKITGINKANASSILSLTATGAIAIKGNGSSASITINSSGEGTAFNSIGGGKTNKITGGNTASGLTAINLKAGTTISISGSAVTLEHYDADAEAYNSIAGTDNVIIGSNTATGADNVSLIAGGALSIAATTGDISFNGSSANVSAYNYASGKHDTITGNNVASAGNGFTIRGASVSMAADSNITFSGNLVTSASAYNEAVGVGSHTITGNNKATATAKYDITATAGDLTMTATNGDISFVGNSVEAYAYNDVQGGADKNIISGTHVATANQAISLSATGAIKLNAQTGVYLYVGSVTASAYNHINGSNNKVGGNQIAIASNTLSLKAGKGIDINGHTGSVYISGSGSVTASAYNYIVAGKGNTVTGSHNATATGLISLSAPTISIAGDGVYIYGTSATASAYNQTFGSSNNINGANKATATTSILLAATGAISINGTTGNVQISGSESATASAYNYANGKKNKVGGANIATAGNTISISAGGNLTISGHNASIYVYGASASAYNYAASGSTSLNGNTVVGNQTAKATGNVTLKAGGDVAITATGGDLNIEALDSAFASAYNKVASGKFNKVIGNNIASANNTLSISGKAITLAAYRNLAGTAGGGVDIEGSTGSALAYNYINGSNNTINGTNNAGANTALLITASGNLSITGDTANTVDISNSGGATGSAYNSIAAGKKNSIAGGNTANGNVTISLTAGGILNIAGGSVNMSNYSASGTAYNYANGSSNNIGTALLPANNIASGKNTLNIKALGAINMIATAANGHVRVSASSADASAYNSARGGKQNNVIGSNNATAASVINISGSSISMQATGLNGDVRISNSTASGTAYNYTAGGKLNKVTGNNTASATTTVSLSATGDITLSGGAGATGTVSVSNDEALASAYNSGNFSNILNEGSTITGSNKMTAAATLSINAGGNLALAAHNVNIYGDNASGSAYNRHFGDFNKISGNNIATGTVLTSLTAGKAITIAATGGTALISANDSASAFAINRAVDGGSHNTIVGNNTASGFNDIVIKGGTAINISGNSVDVEGNHGSAQAYHRAGGDNLNTFTGNNAATARNSVTLNAGLGGITVTAANGDVTVDGNGVASAYASHKAGVSAGNLGSTNTLSGTDVASATNNITLTTTGNLALKASNDVTVSGANNFASASNQVYGNNNTFTGANTATATNSVTLTAAGNIDLRAGNKASVFTQGATSAYALQKVNNGTGNKLGANIATGNNTVVLKATKNISISGDASFATGVYITTGAGGSATASDAVGSNAVAAVGANTAIANAGTTITAGGTLSLAAPNGYVYVYNAGSGSYSATARGKGVNTATFNNKVTLAATGALNISGGYVGIVPAYYHGNALASGAATTAVNSATINGDINISGASVAISADSSGVSIYGFSSGDGAKANATGQGKNTALATANTNITATGALDIFSASYIYMAGVNDAAFTEQAYASATNVGDKASATVHTDITLKGGSVTMATAGDLQMGNNNPSGSAFAWDQGGSGTRNASLSNNIKVLAGKLTLNAANVTIEGGSALMVGTNAKAEASTLVLTNTGSITTTGASGDLSVIAGDGKYSVAGIAATTGLTLAIADDVFVTGGGQDFQVVNGTYVRNITDAMWRYGTTAGAAISPAGTGVVTPGVSPTLTAFGVTGDYIYSDTDAGANTSPAAFIQIK